MKAKTKHGVGKSQCLLFFVYEDWGGDRFYRSYESAKQDLGNEVYLTAYLHNTYYNIRERVDSKCLKRKPTIKRIKSFIKNCKAILKWL